MADALGLGIRCRVDETERIGHRRAKTRPLQLGEMEVGRGTERCDRGPLHLQFGECGGILCVVVHLLIRAIIL